MARARNIKPGFFANDRLAECDPLARILFAGLWTIADRAGRMEDRPKRIRAAILPYDDCDIDALLSQLDAGGFIQRYQAGGMALIQVLAFDKHQNPHKNEAESTLPAPSADEVKAEQNDVTTEQHSTSTVQAPEQHSTNRADSLNPITDSLCSVANATDAANGVKKPMTPEEIIFTYGVPLLTNAGSTDKQARSFFGGLRKAHGDAAVIDKLRDCLREKPLQPLEWLAAALPPAGSSRRQQHNAGNKHTAAARAIYGAPETDSLGVIDVEATVRHH